MHYKGTKSALSRRAFVGRLAAGAAAACAAGVGTAQAVVSRRQPHIGSGAENHLAPPAAPHEELAHAPVSAPPPWELLYPLAAGASVGDGWRLADLGGVADGSCVLTLKNERGRTHRVHICRNDGSPMGVVYARQFDLLVMNGGQGDLPTDEGLAQAVAEVAHVLAANEGDSQHRTTVAALLPQAERVTRFSGVASLR